MIENVRSIGIGKASCVEKETARLIPAAPNPGKTVNGI
jgi:hypothetical protein